MQQTKPSNLSKPSRYLTASEVAAVFHVTPKTVSRWGQEGKLPYMRTLGGHRRYPADVIEALATTRETDAKEPSSTATGNRPTSNADLPSRARPRDDP